YAQATEVNEAFEAIIPIEDIEAAMGGRLRSSPSMRRLELTQTTSDAFETQSSDHLAVALSDEVLGRRNIGWLYATIGGVVTVALIVFLLLEFAPRTH